MSIGPATMTSRPFDSFNLERVEVLKGPSSMLYGESAVGGTVTFITNWPVRGKREIESLAGYGSFDSLRLAGTARFAAECIGTTSSASAVRGSC